MQDERARVMDDSTAQEYTATFETNLPAFLADAEKAYLRYCLIRAGGNRADAAKAAGVPYETFVKKLKRHGLRVRVVAVEVTVDL